MTRSNAVPTLAIVIGLTGVLLAASVVIGADTMWMVALGDTIAREGRIVSGIPYASAPTDAWANLPVLGELAFAALHHLGPSALPAAQIVATCCALTLLALGALREGAAPAITAAVVALAVVAGLPAFGIVRGQLFSLIPFAALVVLLRSEYQKPTWRVWYVVPLIAVWGNLHGAVLVGLALLWCYLALSRLSVQPLTALGVGISSSMALFINPAFTATPSYYLGVLQNEAARRGAQLWAAPSLDNVGDSLMVVAGVPLLVLVLSRRRSWWEYAAMSGLLLGTVMARRNAVWLALFLVIPAATAATAAWRARRGRPSALRVHPLAHIAAAGALAVLAALLLAGRADSFAMVDRQAATMTALTRGRVVLAPDRVAEAMAASGATLWVANPIDAFTTADQSAYLDFLDGRGPQLHRALSSVQAVVAERGSWAARAAQAYGFTTTGRVGPFEVMLRDQ